MKIVKVEPVLLSYEYTPEEQWGWSGGEVKGWHTSLVRVWTDEGIYGLGEMGTGHYIPEAAKAICNFLANTLIGQDPFAVNVLFDKMYKLGANWGRRGIAIGVISGIENALWDLKGKALGLPDNMVFRQPFPGPGLGVRCLGAITRDRLEAVRESDAILREEFAKNGLEGKVWQYFTAVPDFKSVGVKEGARTFAYPVILRAVNTVDAMTATVENVPFELLEHITERITHEVEGVNRVLYDLTPKPVGTIEWE